jgi:hypothetical protein
MILRTLKALVFSVSPSFHEIFPGPTLIVCVKDAEGNGDMSQQSILKNLITTKDAQ